MLQRMLALFVVVGLVSPALAQKANLKWKFEKGKTFYQKMDTTTTQKMKVMGSDVNQTQKQTFYFKWTVKDVKGDDVELTQTIEGVQMDIDIGGQKISYDSTKADQQANPLGEFFKALVGSEFTITLNTKDMKVTKVDGRDEFLKKLNAANPAMQPLLDKILSADALKEMADPTFAAVPNAEKNKGDTWSRKSTLDMGPIGKYENEYKYTYDGQTDKKDKIKVETTLKYIKPDMAAAGALPFKIKDADLTSKNAAGTITFDADKGRIEKSEMSINLAGKLTIEIGGQPTSVDLDQTQKTVVENADTSFKK